MNEEARARGLALESDAGLRQALLAELIDRKLLVAAARERGIDRTPGYVLAERRQREILLAQQLLAEGSSAETLSRGELQAFVDANPQAFARRIVARAEQLAFAGPISPGLRAALAAASDADAMEEVLRRAGRPVRRTLESWDSADPATPLWTGAVRPETGARFLLPRGNDIIAGVVTEVLPQPVPEGEQPRLARALIGRIAAERRMTELLRGARTDAVVAVQPGFEAGAGGTTPPAPRP